MRFQVDLNLSPQLALRLCDLGHDAVHGSDLGLLAAPDEVVLEQTRLEGRVLISADSIQTLGRSWRRRVPLRRQ